jgi:hypothetical protein
LPQDELRAFYRISGDDEEIDNQTAIRLKRKLFSSNYFRSRDIINSSSFSRTIMENRLPEFITIDEVANNLRVPISSLDKLEQQGNIPEAKMG